MNVPTPATQWTASDVAALLRDLVDTSTLSTKWIGSGAWSDCFAFVAGGRDMVIRIGRFGDDFQVDQFVGRYSTPDLPIPQTTLVAPLGDEFLAISEFVPGQPLEQVETWDQMVTGIAGLLEALRHADITHLSGWGRWTPTTGGQASTWREFLQAVDQDPAGTRVHGWKAQLAASSSASRAFARGYEQLRSTIVDDIPRSLAHNDLLNRNVHVTGHSVTGIFDWGNSLLGDHLYDLALFCFWEQWLPHVQAQPVVDAVRSQWSCQDSIMRDFDDRLRSCVLHIALEHIAYHALHNHWGEVQRVSDRMDAVATRRW